MKIILKIITILLYISTSTFCQTPDQLNYITSNVHYGEAKDVKIGSNGTIFLANGTSGIIVYTFDGQIFTNISHLKIEPSNDFRGGVLIVEGIFDLSENRLFLDTNDGLLICDFINNSLEIVHRLNKNLDHLQILSDNMFVASYRDYLYLYEYDNEGVEQVKKIDFSWDIRQLGANNNFIFFSNSEGFLAYQVSENELEYISKIENFNPSIFSINNDNFIYALDDGTLIAYSFNGTTFTKVTELYNKDLKYADDLMSVSSDNNIFLINEYKGIYAYTFNEGKFNYKSEWYANPTWEFMAHGISVSTNNTVFIANGKFGLHAYRYNGTNIVQAGHIDDGGEANDVQFIGDMALVANGTAGLYAYKFDGSELHTLAHIDDNLEAYALSVDLSKNIIVSNLENNVTKICKYTFNGDSFEKIFTGIVDGVSNNPIIKTMINNDGIIFASFSFGGIDALRIEGNKLNKLASLYLNTYECDFAMDQQGNIFVANSGQLYAYSFTGSSFEQITSLAVPSSTEGYAVECANNIVFVSGGDENKLLIAVEFKDNNFNKLSETEINYDIVDIVVYMNKYIFTSSRHSETIRTYVFEGSNFSLESKTSVSGTGIALNDKGYIFNIRIDEKSFDIYGYNDFLATVKENNIVLSNLFLDQNYPNPFNPETIISFSLPKKSQVNISIHDVNGRMVEQLLNNFCNAGNYNIQWNAVNQPSGTYLIKLNTGNHQEIRKCLLLK